MALVRLCRHYPACNACLAAFAFRPHPFLHTPMGVRAPGSVVGLMLARRAPLLLGTHAKGSSCQPQGQSYCYNRFPVLHTLPPWLWDPLPILGVEGPVVLQVVQIVRLGLQSLSFIIVYEALHEPRHRPGAAHEILSEPLEDPRQGKLLGVEAVTGRIVDEGTCRFGQLLV